ncbi:MAG: hypothetical protein RI897_2344 [Verrucomicrobiota bacterium]
MGEQEREEDQSQDEGGGIHEWVLVGFPGERADDVLEREQEDERAADGEGEVDVAHFDAEGWRDLVGEPGQLDEVDASEDEDERGEQCDHEVGDGFRDAALLGGEVLGEEVHAEVGFAAKGGAGAEESEPDDEEGGEFVSPGAGLSGDVAAGDLPEDIEDQGGHEDDDRGIEESGEEMSDLGDRGGHRVQGVAWICRMRWPTGEFW